MQPAAFFFWLAVCAISSWRTAFQMPDGFGNAIFLCQLLAAAVSSILMAMYLPFALKPNLRVTTGYDFMNSRITTSTVPRKTAIRGTLIGFAVFLAGNLGGYGIEQAMGLPKRYVDDAVSPIATWVSHEPELARCLGTVWAPATRCQLEFVVTVPSERADVETARASIAQARCDGHATVLEQCARTTLRNGTIKLSPRRIDSFAYAEQTAVAITTMLVGSGPPPPVERGP